MNCKMRKGSLLIVLGAIMIFWVGCTTDDTGYIATEAPVSENGINTTYSVFDGEWTVNKQEVDTARLEVLGSRLRVRLPERYLMRLCLSYLDSTKFDYMSDVNDGLSGNDVPEELPKSEPVDLISTIQGYSENAQFSTISSNVISYDNETVFTNGYFYAQIYGTSCQIDLLSKESGSIVYRMDTGLWTIALTVSGFLVTRLDTDMQMVCHLPIAATLYYNAKERIR